MRLPARPVISALGGLGCLLALAEQLPWAVMQTTDWMLAVMALAVAATAIPEDVVIHGAEAVNVTYPGFVDDLASLGGVAACDAC